MVHFVLWAIQKSISFKLGRQEQGIPISYDYSLRGILSTPVEARVWSIWGLPTNDVSVDDGILVTRGKRWPLMIDPQEQANNWIKPMEAKNGLRIVTLSYGYLLRTIESSIRIGNPILVEDIRDHLDSNVRINLTETGSDF